MGPIETLMHEHKIILAVLDSAEKETSAASLNVEKITQMVDFFQNFADRCHHSKEEKQLFVMMQDRGGSKTQGPISVMLQEHTVGRNRVKAIAEAIPEVQKGSVEAAESIRVNLRNYIDLLRGHIHKEDNILYKIAASVLSEADLKTLNDAFEKIESEEMGDGVHEKYHQLAHHLSD
ncbi:hemerythrin domain-containing protein [bacterium]|nr:hemerythrin domain-containing protein [bacterium]MBU1880741.1 hemerythrin domain-containing protein [bacterium]